MLKIKVTLQKSYKISISGTPFVSPTFPIPFKVRYNAAATHFCSPVLLLFCSSARRHRRRRSRPLVSSYDLPALLVCVRVASNELPQNDDHNIPSREQVSRNSPWLLLRDPDPKGVRIKYPTFIDDRGDRVVVVGRALTFNDP